ncbi:MAG: PIN domain protein [Fibrobacterota bacterium]
MKIYLDNCCFNRPFDSQISVRIRVETEAKLYIQEQIRKRRLQLVWSYMLDFENQANPFKERRYSIARWKRLAGADIAGGNKTLRLAAALRRMGLGPKDVLHLACAIEGKCDYFLTTDDGILKAAGHIKDIRIIDPPSFLREVAHED